MKKLLALSATALLVGTLVGCSADEPKQKVEPKPPVNQEAEKPATSTEVIPIETAMTVGEIKEVREVEGKKSILVTGGNGDIVFNIQEDTVIDKEVSLEVGNTIFVEHSNVMTRSLPPQSNALVIGLDKAVSTGEEIKSIKTTGLIQEVIETEGRKAIKLGGNGTEIIFNIDEKTDFNFDLKEGQQVVVEHSPVMTLSLPAQSYAISISLLK